MPEDEAIYELSMIRDRLDEIDKIFGQERPTVGIGGKLIDDASRMQLAACIEKALALADAIAGYCQLELTGSTSGGRVVVMRHAQPASAVKSQVSYHRHRFPRDVIALAVWLYYRFPLSLRIALGQQIWPSHRAPHPRETAFSRR